MKYFTIDELCRSDTAVRLGLANRPTAEAERKLTALVDHVLDPLRAAWGGPITVTSGYRCAALNNAVGGVANSQHLLGEAADITVGSRNDNRRLFALAQSLGLPFDQLIDEKGMKWIHVSYSPRHRRQVLKL